MPQHSMKKKTTMPKGVKAKVKKEKPKGPKKGQFVHIAPKKQAVIRQEKIEAEVTRVINEKNMDMVRNRADTSVGRTSKKL